MTSPANLFGDEPNPAEDRMADTTSPRGTCRRCGRALRAAESVAAGIGPECARLEAAHPNQPATAAGELVDAYTDAEACDRPGWYTEAYDG